jgi:hypothetical protein
LLGSFEHVVKVAGDGAVPLVDHGGGQTLVAGSTRTPNTVRVIL